MNAHDSSESRGRSSRSGSARRSRRPKRTSSSSTRARSARSRISASRRTWAMRKALKARNPDAIVAVGGCYAEAQRERLFELYPFVDVAFGPGTIPHLADWIGADGQDVARGSFGTGEAIVLGRAATASRGRFQAWVQVSMGCNSKCAYCIVPAVRGREVSRRPGDVVAEVTGSRARAFARSRCSARTSTRGVATSAGPRHRLRRASPRLRRRRGHRADPLHEPAPEGLPRAGHRRDRGLQRRVRARPPAAQSGSSRS